MDVDNIPSRQRKRHIKNRWMGGRIDVDYPAALSVTAPYRPLALEDLVLTTRELERIRADVQFVTTENPTKEDIRQRLRYYRTLDIVDEQCT